MSNGAAHLVSSVIREHTQRKTIEELTAGGKRQFRVVSGQKVIQLIEAIVDDAIRRGTSELARRDRDRIVRDTKGQFEKVLRLQSQQEELVRRAQAEAEQHRERADRLSRELAEERDRAAETDVGNAARDQEMAEQLARFEALDARFAEEQARRIRTEGLLPELDRLVQEAQRGVQAREKTIARLTEEIYAITARMEQDNGCLAAAQERALAEAATRAERMAGTVRAAEDRVKRMERVVSRLRDSRGRLLRKVERLGTATNGATSAAELRDELREIRASLHTYAERSGKLGESDVDALLARLDQRDAGRERSFGDQFDRTLDEISRAVRRATTGPIDDPVEATEALVARMFEQGGEMTTNLGSLAVTEHSARNGIASNLVRLRAVRGRTEQKPAST